VKIIQPFVATILFLSVVCCAGKNQQEAAKDDVAPIATPAIAAPKDTFATGKVISSVFCKNDASQSYALYIPQAASNESLPVIYFFDPHGSGTFPLSKYKSLAERYHFIFIGSNNSKNGNDLATAEKIWTILAADTKARLHIKPGRMYVCGFSGGGKVACYVAMQHAEVKAVIANGGALPEIATGNFHFTFTAIAGEGDMNMTELVAITNELNKTTTRHRIIFFNGKHEWAPETTMDIAITGLQLDAMRDRSIPADMHFIQSFIRNTEGKIDADLKSGNYLEAANECNLFASLVDADSIKEAKTIKQKAAAIQSNPAYQKQLRDKQNLVTKEQSWKDQFNEKFGVADINYWQTTISDFQQQSRKQTAEGAMYQRLLAYLSLAFYSISNQLITTNRNQDAQHFVDLYKMVDPSNSEAWYFSAILDARNNDVAAAENDLQKAVSNGFTDKDRMRQQTEFKNIHVNFPGIENKMKTNP
jgi:predicted esterase